MGPQPPTLIRRLLARLRVRPGRWLALLAVVGLLAVACGGDTEPGAGTSPDGASPTGDGTAAAGQIADEFDLSGASLTVGSKEFTEQLILGHITVKALEAAGADVDDQTGLVGSATVREALTSGSIDMYWEYTGTGWITHLGNDEPVTGAQAQYEAVRDADADNSIAWLEPASFDNTYAIAARQDAAADLGVASLSDYAQLATDNPEAASLCAASEFLNRSDGWPGVEDHYGFDLPGGQIAEMELSFIYTRVDQGDPCNFGEVFATDGRIAAFDLVVLEDDQEFFPTYLPSLNVRQEVLDEWPALSDLGALLAGELDTETIRQLNARVDVDGEDPEAVAEDWLREQGLIA